MYSFYIAPVLEEKHSKTRNILQALHSLRSIDKTCTGYVVDPLNRTFSVTEGNSCGPRLVVGTLDTTRKSRIS